MLWSPTVARVVPCRSAVGADSTRVRRVQCTPGYAPPTRVLQVYACGRLPPVHVDTRVSTVERRALTVRDPNLNPMRFRYSVTVLFNFDLS